MRGDHFSDIVRALAELELEETVKSVEEKVEAGVSAKEILNRGLMQGLKEVGDRFEKKTYFLSDILFAATIVNQCMEILDPLLQRETEKAPKIGTAVIGTVQGDIHDIGKNIVITLMNAAGLEVHDLGVDVPAEKFVEKVEEVKADILGMSAILPTTAPNFKVVVDALEEAGLRSRILVLIGGPPLVTKEEVGADHYCGDAFKGVELALDYIRKRESTPK